MKVKKQIYNHKLDAVSAEVTNESNAETAVATAESETKQAQNVTAAQAAIDVLTNETVKDQLQARFGCCFLTLSQQQLHKTILLQVIQHTALTVILILIRLSLIAILTDTNYYVNRAYLFSHWRNLF